MFVSLGLLLLFCDRSFKFKGYGYASHYAYLFILLVTSRKVPTTFQGKINIHLQKYPFVYIIKKIQVIRYYYEGYSVLVWMGSVA